MLSGKSSSNVGVSWGSHVILKYSNTQQMKESVSEKIITQVTYDVYSLYVV